MASGRKFIVETKNWQGTYSRLSQITQPTLIITGTDGVLTPPGNSLTQDPFVLFGVDI